MEADLDGVLNNLLNRTKQYIYYKKKPPKMLGLSTKVVFFSR